MNIITEEFVKETLNNNGFIVNKIKTLTGGSNHYVFSINTSDNKDIIVKFPKIRETERAFSKGHKDTLFGGALSPQREAYLLNLIRQSGLPTPKVHGIFPTKKGNCIVVERSSGCNLVDYMNKEEHSREKFLEIISDLGSSFSKLHKTRFGSFGNIMENSLIEPSKILNFADRYLPINDILLERSYLKGGINKQEMKILKDFFDCEFEKYRERLNIKNSPATLVITDMHGDNFFIENGKISGFFDVESSQAAPFEYELYCLRFFVFNYYSEEEYALAQKCFCLRDTWGERIKKILFKYIETKKVDYISLGSIWRERDKQPLHFNN